MLSGRGSGAKHISLSHHGGGGERGRAEEEEEEKKKSGGERRRNRRWQVQSFPLALAGEGLHQAATSWENCALLFRGPLATRAFLKLSKQLSHTNGRNAKTLLSERAAKTVQGCCVGSLERPSWKLLFLSLTVRRGKKKNFQKIFSDYMAVDKLLYVERKGEIMTDFQIQKKRICEGKAGIVKTCSYQPSKIHCYKKTTTNDFITWWSSQVSF